MSYQLHNASRTAKHFADILLPHCEPGRFFFAGSLRREQTEVHDIEIVCTPKKELKIDPAILFDEGTLVVSPDFIHGLAQITDIIILGKPEGRYMKIKTNSTMCRGIHLDVFMPQPVDFFRQLVIRTGSKDYAHNIIASAWVRKGWVGVKELGLRRKEQCIDSCTNPGKDWRLMEGIEKPLLPPVWKSEEDFYSWLGLQWISPKYREYKQKQTT